MGNKLARLGDSQWKYDILDRGVRNFIEEKWCGWIAKLS